MKQVIVVNEELNLPRGKLAAQVAHAAVGALLEAKASARSAWLADGMAKVVLVGNSAAHLTELEALARAAGLPVMLIEDAGRTVVPEGTVTCLGIGPAKDEAFAPITGALKLLR
ncbi:MAG: peptidyl-tRNA hydrolase Pth2 [Pseudomonadota bacterium]